MIKICQVHVRVVGNVSLRVVSTFQVNNRDLRTMFGMNYRRSTSIFNFYGHLTNVFPFVI